LSRACLGRVIILYQKWRKRTRFLTCPQTTPRARAEDDSPSETAWCLLAAPDSPAGSSDHSRGRSKSDHHVRCGDAGLHCACGPRAVRHQGRPAGTRSRSSSAMIRVAPLAGHSRLSLKAERQTPPTVLSQRRAELAKLKCSRDLVA
jgi:hypothetical protein